jgi:hypothetical protein
VAQPCRPRLLDPALAEALITFAEAGLTIEDAAHAAGVAPRSLRRWRAEGQREIDALSTEARLALAFGQARASGARNGIDWRESARFLERASAECWADPVGADDLLGDLGSPTEPT